MAVSSLISSGPGLATSLTVTSKVGFLAGEMRGLVVFGEGDGDLLLVAGLGADQLVLEAGDEFLRAEHQRLVRAGAAVEGSPSILPT